MPQRNHESLIRFLNDTFHFMVTTIWILLVAILLMIFYLLVKMQNQQCKQ